ncbi:CapA family protein [Williamwhitmania taraxaci]|uniref:Poly-gamma-glutamate synthesis protein (Capsule biosynthesis protein) n=1 Tax=Williamwhitmania taraxaci TaxID=1640674 RepID=A0A1G6P727_9BACT|nr:CapA family protein [Williamwhitmania taraxaci]SDC76070.1 poly-gamma-glutamate synthesis protein (capsule biosynthesis protein) [Williamwhitmania taraxaci]
MLRIVVIVSLILFVARAEAQPIPLTPTDSTLTLLFIGDVMGHGPQINSAYDTVTDTYSYDTVFSRIRPFIELSDIAIANLEVTLAGKPYTGYPTFSSPVALAAALKTAGVDILATANNHSADRSKNGITRTIEELNKLNIPHTGTFANQAERDTTYPLIIEKNGFRLALLNCTYGTNGIEVPKPTLVNTIDTAQIRRDYYRARLLNVDEVIAFVHWGVEYQEEPNAEQIAIAAYLHKLGIRIVIGSHPHVIQRMEATYDSDTTVGNITVYSLGNFVSNQRTRNRNGGALAYIKLTKHEKKTQIKAGGYLLAWVQTPMRNGRKVYQVLPVSEYEQLEGYFSPADQALFDEFAKDSRDLYGRRNRNFPELIFLKRTGKWLLP